MDSDAKAIIGTIVGTGLVVAGLLSAQVAGLNTRIDDLRADVYRIDDRMGRIDDRMGRIEARMDLLVARVDQIDGRMSRLEARVDQIDGRMDRLETRVEQIDTRLDAVEVALGRIDQRLLTIERVVLPSAAPGEQASTGSIGRRRTGLVRHRCRGNRREDP